MGMREVAAGAAWLDENFPGWERKIDLGILNIDSCQNCICGQSLAEYVRNSKGYDTGYNFAEELLWADFKNGKMDEPTYIAADASFLYLENESLWRDLIKERFNTGNLSDE